MCLKKILKEDPQAGLIPQLNYEDALAIIRKGAKVLQERSVGLASSHGVPLHVTSFQLSGAGGDGTLICDAVKCRPDKPFYETTS